MIMRDSINASAIPLDTPVVAGYGDGQFQWSSADWLRFPFNSITLSIVVSALHSGDILDVETSDATPAEVPGWVRRFSRPGRRKPTIYSNRSTWAQIVAALVAAGLSAADVDWWAATLDGTTDVPGAVAVQYRDFGPYDESIILDPTWVGISGGDDMAGFEDTTLGQKMDQLCNVLLGGGDNRVPAPWIATRLTSLDAVRAELDALKAELESNPGSTDATAAIARIEKALQGA